MRNLLLVRYGEIFLKGQNRPLFMRALVKRIKYAVKDLGATVLLHDGRILVSDFDDLDECIRRVTKVFGVHSVCPAVEMPKDDFDALCNQAVAMMADLSGTFRVTARRSDKNYFMDSPAINIEMGHRILTANKNLSVDVKKPQHTMNVEIRDMAYLYVKVIPAVGGMPVGTNGRATLLLSGGIDSPVAAYMMAKRGVEVEAVHFFSYPYTSQLAKDKVIELARLVTKYSGRMTVNVVSFTEIQEAIRDNCPEEFFTLIMRRFMMEIAQRIAKNDGCGALITGENLGQVASQTMEAMTVTGAVVDVPIFMPLVGMDKKDIISIAREIGTLDTSILPYEDCCTVFTPKHPKTKPTLGQVENAEKKLDREALIARALENVEKIKVTYHDEPLL